MRARRCVIAAVPLLLLLTACSSSRCLPAEPALVARMKVDMQIVSAARMEHSEPGVSLVVIEVTPWVEVVDDYLEWIAVYATDIDPSGRGRGTIEPANILARTLWKATADPPTAAVAAAALDEEAVFHAEQCLRKPR